MINDDHDGDVDGDADVDADNESEDNKYLQVDEQKIKCKVGKPVSKKIPWKNEENKVMSQQLLSSDEEIMQVKVDQVELSPGEATHFKIKILPGGGVGENTV